MTAAQRVRLWDAPTRLVHWLLVVLVAFSWWTAEEGHLEWHRYSGYGLLGLVLFRIYWGFVGSQSSRFGHFVKGPGAIVAYLRGTSVAEPGHNPLGALSVLALLTLLLTQIILGLFAVDIDGIESGPLSHLVSFDVGRQFAEFHEWIFNALMVFIALHVAAILYYLLLKRDNLIGPMITGFKSWSSASTLKFASLWLVLPGAAIAGAIVWYIAK